jgi:hypothetical protein
MSSSTTLFKDEQAEIIFDSIKPGSYTLSLWIEPDYYSKKNIIIVRDSILSFYTTIEKPYYSKIYDSLRSEIPEASFFMNIGPLNIKNNVDPRLNNSYTVGTSQHFLFPLANHFSFLTNVGSSITYEDFKNSQTLNPAFIKKRERMLAWNFIMGIGNRISFNNARVNATKGVIIDYGANYNFPLLFNHSIINGPNRIVNKRIHQFTDFSTFVRIGYFPVTIIAEYRLSDYVISGYPEMPKLKFGIEILISQ